VAPEEAAFIALKEWAGTGRKCRQALKRANPTAVEELELHYLQFMRQVEVFLVQHRLPMYIMAQMHSRMANAQHGRQV